MTMDYKSNSHRSKSEKPEEKKIEKVASGKVRKKSGLSKIRDNLLSEDVGSMKTYIFTEVFIPAAKKAISDIVDMALYGEIRSKKRGSSSSIPYISYDRFSSDNRRSKSNERRRYNVNYTYDDIILDTRGEADEVLDQLIAIIDEFDVASVADLYDLVGVSRNFTDQKYGWDNLSSASVDRVRGGGYVLRLPRAKPI